MRRCCARPAVTVVVGVALAALGGGYAVLTLTLETSKFELLPGNQRYATLYKSYSEEFGQLEDIIVVVQSPAVETSTAYAARLARGLHEGALSTARITYRIDAGRLAERGLTYLPLEKLSNILDTVAGQEEMLAAFAATPTLSQLMDGINQDVGSMFLPEVLGSRQEPSTAPTRLLADLLSQMSSRLDGGAYRSPWSSLIAVPATASAGDGYFLSADGRLLYMVVGLGGAPRTPDMDRAAIVAIRGAIASLRPQFPSVEAGVTGAPALFSDELSAAAGDGQTASILALVLTLALLLLAFRRLVTSCAMLAVLAVSLGWSMGVVTLTVGHLTSFSVMFVSVVIGIGIDYGILFLFRYQEERLFGRTLLAALERTAARTGPGLLLGALTAAVTFYILTIDGFRGIRDFGFISGTAILLAFVAMMTVFPAVLLLIDRHRSGVLSIVGGTDHRRVRAQDMRQARQIPALERLVRHPKAVLTAAVLVTAAALWAAPRVGFDHNLLNLQAVGTESVVWEKKIAAAAGRSGFAALTTASSLEELEAKRAAFRTLPSVSEVDSVLSVLPDRQAEKFAVLGRLAAVVDSIHMGPPRPLDLDALTAALETLQRRIGLAIASSGGDAPRGDMLVIARETSALLARLTARRGPAVEITLTDFQSKLTADFAEQWRQLQRAVRPAPVTLADVPDELRRRFIGSSGRLLMQVYSRLDVWEPTGQTRFVQELRTVDRDVTGQPVVAYELMRLIERASRQGVAYAFVLVAAIAALMIRRLRETALALVPLGLGTLWTVGLMQVIGLRFNLLNVWALPLIIGSAAEYGVNIVLRAREARQHGGPLLARSTVMGVTFNGLTTIAGFGSLLVAHHRGVWSLGLLLVIGTAMTLTASLVVLPTLVRLTRARTQPPATAAVAGFVKAIAASVASIGAGRVHYRARRPSS